MDCNEACMEAAANERESVEIKGLETLASKVREARLAAEMAWKAYAEAERIEEEAFHAARRADGLLALARHDLDRYATGLASTEDAPGGAVRAMAYLRRKRESV